MHKEIGNVYMTNDLSMFKTLNANREVKESRKQVLIQSIGKHGYIPAPIIVNEKYEVIDGQGRLAACKELGTQISYTIVPGAGIAECIVLNANGKTWTMHDYIKSYAEQGNENYQRLLKLAEMGFGIRTYMFANSIYGGTSHTELLIKEGRAISSQKCFEKAEEALRFLEPLKPYTKLIIGRKTDLESAILFAYADSNCDNKRLVEAISRYYNRSELQNIIGLESAMKGVSAIYNFNLRRAIDRLYLDQDYDRFKHEGGRK